MTFKEAVAALAQKLGVEIAVEGDACALRASAKDGTAVTIWMQGSDERGTVLTGADLGAPPPERLERLYRAMLEGNDLFRDTGGATRSRCARSPCEGRTNVCRRRLGSELSHFQQVQRRRRTEKW